MDAIGPYRSVEITRVVECEACERSRVNREAIRRRRAERVMAFIRGTARTMTIGPWLGGLFYLDGRVLGLGDSYGFLGAMLIVTTLIAMVCSIRYIGWGTLRDDNSSSHTKEPK